MYTYILFFFPWPFLFRCRNGGINLIEDWEFVLLNFVYLHNQVSGFFWNVIFLYVCLNAQWKGDRGNNIFISLCLWVCIEGNRKGKKIGLCYGYKEAMWHWIKGQDKSEKSKTCCTLVWEVTCFFESQLFHLNQSLPCPYPVL